MRNLVILGSTGSIGRQTLEVVERFPDRYRVLGLAAYRQADVLLDQIRRFHPQAVALADSQSAARLRQQLQGAGGPVPRILGGEEALTELAAWPGADMVLVAVVGAAGVRPTLAAIEAGRTVALANKETLVTAGHLVTAAAARRGVAVLPVDSEHSAVFQCLQGSSRASLRRIVLTASGGPFLRTPAGQLERVTAEAALRHPNWKMGSKITVDSATLMNKGLEVIEAHWLFGAAFEQVDVVVHPESIVHSLVEFQDGAVLAQLGWPDMHLPIQYALSYPERWPGGVRPLDLAAVGSLHFEAPDTARFPCLPLAIQAGKIGGTMPAVMNAANEIAVQAFLAGRIRFPHIARIVAQIMEKHVVTASPSLDEVVDADAWARREAQRMATECSQP
ncbi:MAG: 1-deoxy-D-xylulose-5-phosphate reductoisomerase [Firmicutes bacterium]|nr:1-deoxy-D-xylulose-5-phosphate reductoisomerase [Bacillota bacterium]